MRKVYIDRKLKKYIVPQEMRNNSKAENKIFTPGTRISLPEEVKTVRLFTAWASKDGSASEIDIDLSGAFIKEKDSVFFIESISFHDQSTSYAVHSGDFTSCKAVTKENPEYTSEFIDVDLDMVKDLGFKYVLTTELVFRGDYSTSVENYSDMNVYSGVQLLNELRTEKKQSINLNDSLFKVKLNGNFKSHIAIALDLETMEIVIIDQYDEGVHGLTVESMVKKLQEYKKLYFNALDFSENLYDFLEMYCEANSFVITEDITKADIVCSYNDYKLEPNQIMFNISNNLEKIMSLLKLEFINKTKKGHLWL